MATERLSMRKTREILRHRWVLGRGYRDVARSVDVSLGAVWLAVQRAAEAGLDWAAVEALDDGALEAIRAGGGRRKAGCHRWPGTKNTIPPTKPTHRKSPENPYPPPDPKSGASTSSAILA
jgi:hypothetical protein